MAVREAVVEAVELGVDVEGAVACAVDERLARLAVVEGLVVLVGRAVTCPVPDPVPLEDTVALTDRVVEGVPVTVLDVEGVAVGVRPLVTVPVGDLVLVANADPVRVMLGVPVLVIVTEGEPVFNPVRVEVRLGVIVPDWVCVIVCVGKGLVVTEGLGVLDGEGVIEEVIV
jgi:hypothetical protein